MAYGLRDRTRLASPKRLIDEIGREPKRRRRNNAVPPPGPLPGPAPIPLPIPASIPVTIPAPVPAPPVFGPNGWSDRLPLELRRQIYSDVCEKIILRPIP
jgi:hypothetical protein